MLRAMVVGPRADCFDPTVSGGALLDGGIERHGHRTACGEVMCGNQRRPRNRPGHRDPAGRGGRARGGRRSGLRRRPAGRRRHGGGDAAHLVLPDTQLEPELLHRDHRRRGRLVAQAEYIPVHVGAMPASVLATLEAFGDAIHPGDVFLRNDPYFGGSQLPDLTACLPVFVGERLLCWALNRAHHSDIAGATPGAYHASATEIWQEGLRAPPRSRRRSGSRPARSSPARRRGVADTLTAHPGEGGPARRRREISSAG